MSKKDEAMKLALEALEGLEALLLSMGLTHLIVYGDAEKAITNLQKELEDQPAQRKPLTGAEIRKWWSSENGLEDCRMAKLDDFEKVVRAIEAAHGIKENT